MLETLIGKLSNPQEVFPYLFEPISQQIIIFSMLAFIMIAGIAVVGSITYFKKWSYLWHEWIVTVDHKRIATMYLVVALVMLVRGFTDAVMMRVQQAMASGGLLNSHSSVE
jgi:cytochrome o ubiquinol oxidase subunit 1